MIVIFAAIAIWNVAGCAGEIEQDDPSETNEAAVGHMPTAAQPTAVTTSALHPESSAGPEPTTAPTTTVPREVPPVVPTAVEPEPAAVPPVEPVEPEAEPDEPEATPVDEPEPEGCGPGLIECGDDCADLNADPSHCGECGNVCTAAPGTVASCVAGTCNDCAQGFARCDGVCVNISTDSNNCGVCGRQCGGGQMCSGAVCGCNGGSLSCNGSCINGQSDSNNCGECGRRCNGACVNGTCL